MSVGVVLVLAGGGTAATVVGSEPVWAGAVSTVGSVWVCTRPGGVVTALTGVLVVFTGVLTTGCLTTAAFLSLIATR